MKTKFKIWLISIVMLIIANSSDILSQPSITNLTNTSFTEAGSPVYVGPGVIVNGGGAYGGGYLLFDLSNPDAKDTLKLVSDTNPNVLGAISLVGNTLYLGNGVGVDAVASRDAVLNGINGQDLKFDFLSVDFDFENGYSGWTIVDGFVNLGVDNIAGWLTPNDASDDNPPLVGSTYWHDTSTIHNPPEAFSLHLESNITTQLPCDVVHGPYAYSPTFFAFAGETLSFDWSDVGGPDNYDVKGYLLNVNTGNISMPLPLDSQGGSVGWVTESVNIPLTGTYRLVIVSGTVDTAPCDQVAGASLYIDNVKMISTNADDAVVESIIRRVTYQNDCGTSNATRNLTISAYNTSITGSANSTITLNTSPPVPHCKDITVYLDPSGQVTILGSDINNGSTDNCPMTFVPSQATFTCSDTGANLVVLTVYDSYGNSSTCPATVTVNDTIRPTIICPSDLTIGTNSGCTAIGFNLGTPFTNDNCHIASVTNNAPAILPLGITIFNWTVTDDANNTATCAQVITVEDNVAPTIICLDALTIGTNFGCTAINVNLGTPGTSDNCNVDTVVNDAPIAFLLGTTTVNWTVTDDAGNTATCQQLVTVIDTVPPTIVCPDSLIIGTNVGCTAIGFNLGTPFTSDNCHVASVTNDAPAILTLGITTVNWIVTDDANNMDTCSQVVTVMDNVNPTIICADALTIGTNSGCTAINVDLGTPFTNDNCHIASVTNNAPDTLLLGNTTVTWIVTDDAGNSDTCTQEVTVIDTINPTIICPDTLTIGTNFGCTAINVNLVTPGTSDNCNIDTVVNNAPASFLLGTTTVTWTVTDAAGNIATCQQLVTVIDTIPPTIVCPVNISVNSAPGDCKVTGVVLGFPTYSDNCTVTSITNNAPSEYDVGINYVTWTVTDGSGNISTCEQSVFVGCTPLAIDDSDTILSSTSIDIDVLANDIDCGNNLDPGSVSIATPPYSGIVTVDQLTGIITYTPDYLFSGWDQFGYRVCDSLNLCSTATVYIFVSPVITPILGIAKALSDVELLEDGTYNITYIITAENLGNDKLTNIQITDNLTETFPLPATFKMVNTPNTNSTLIPNVSFNGSTDMNLLNENASYLDVGSSGGIEFTINIHVEIYETEQTFYNYAVGRGTGSLDTIISDTSDNGYVCDPNGNANPADSSENDPTPLTLQPVDVFIPHGFSPDGNGINDVFFIKGIGDYPDSRLSIYNRWGNLIYSVIGYQNDWDGIPNSSLNLGTNIVPQGTYYYILEYNKDERAPVVGYLIIKY